jgi:hypothetical protein
MPCEASLFFPGPLIVMDFGATESVAERDNLLKVSESIDYSRGTFHN